ncbi:MAG: hypothetical protein K5840_03210 [Eubacterium sp.]|nr:hypothetical protein [Eubacterium sp.]
MNKTKRIRKAMGFALSLATAFALAFSGAAGAVQTAQNVYASDAAGSVSVEKQAKVNKKGYTLSKKAGTYTGSVKVKIKAKKGYKVYWSYSKKGFKTKNVVKSGKTKKLTIKKTKTLYVYAVKKSVKLTAKKLKKKAKKNCAKYKYTITSATTSATTSDDNTSTADETVAKSTFQIVSGSNGPLLADETDIASITLKNTGSEAATVTEYNLGVKSTHTVEAGDTVTIAAPSLFSEETQTVCAGSSTTTATEEVPYKLALTVDGVETPVTADTSVTGSDVAVSIVYGVLDYYVSHGSNTARYITCGIYADENGIDATRSVLAAVVPDSALISVSAGDTSVSGVTIASTNDFFSAVRTGGSGEFTIKNSKINLVGDGGDDFTGIGMAFGATDASVLNIEDTNSYTEGILRGALFVGDAGALNVTGLYSDCEPGEYQSDVSISSAGMSSPPNGLGIWGNCRAMNLVDYGQVTIDDSEIIAQNWGVLGVDDVSDGALTVSDSKIVITDQGYGSYAIGKCVDTFKNCTFEIAYGVVNYAAAGSGAEVVLSDGTVGNSLGYYGVVTHQSFNGTNSKITVDGEGTQLNGKYGGIIAKGRGTDIYISDGGVVTATDGPLVRAQINDDTGAGSMDGTEVVNVSVSDTTLEGDIIQGMGDVDVSGETSNMVVSLADGATLNGAISSAFLVLKITDGTISMGNITDVGMIESTTLGNNTAATVDVSLDSTSTWTVTETCYIDSLTLTDAASLKAPTGKTLTMTVDGTETAIAAGTYTGEIVLTVK